ncbi:MAG TPA: hypothetical protein VGH90_04810, partial [Chthoniobacteraceae bacterium]
MPPLQPAHIAALAAFVAFVLFALWLRSREPAFPYEAAEALLTPAEKAFHTALVEALEGDFAIFCKVRLA